MCIMHVNFQFFLQIRDFDSLSLSIWSSAVTSRFMTFFNVMSRGDTSGEGL